MLVSGAVVSGVLNGRDIGDSSAETGGVANGKQDPDGDDDGRVPAEPNTVTSPHIPAVTYQE
ncbi:hypothetical protein GCM10023147_48190 [Tsukamurella soli]|uniref:Uncharacterized protein n=1 Tax=Tsukamurella soli TaxID=644556 RepID=A0ABP8KEY3_9ACTN